MMTFDLDISLRVLPLILRGAWWTVVISLSAFAVSLIGGLIFYGLTISGNRLVARVTAAFCDAVRSTPLLVQVFLIYFVGPHYGIILDPLSAGIIAFGLHYSCYMLEVYRAAAKTVSSGQWEAAHSLGMRPVATFRLVILPQMLPAIVPLAGSYLIYMFKDTPILAAVTVREMMYAAQKFGAENFVYLEPFTLVGLIFLAMSLVSAFIIRLIERRITVWRTAPG